MWYTESGNDSDVVLSSRIRLARNFTGIPFPLKADANQQAEVIEKCKRAAEDSGMGLNFVALNSMKDYEKQALAECHLISPQMMDNSINRGLLLNDNNSICILINEEDHMRIQCMEAGFDIKKCFDAANEADNAIEKSVDYAFDGEFGYLTCCPTNLGTGMRASVMVHLPALTLTRNINSIIDSLSQLGMTVRGIFGEGSKSTGNIYQISNQETLGETEENIIDRFEQIISEVIQKEREMRNQLIKTGGFRLKDKLMRSFGILTNAVIISSDEAMTRLSDVRFAVELGIINTVDYKMLNTALYSILPANIIKSHNIMDAADRDLKRAELIKELLLTKNNI